MGHAEVAVTGVVVVEMPGLASMDRFQATGAGRFAGVDQRGDRGAALLVPVPPSTVAGGARRFAPAAHSSHPSPTDCLGVQLVEGRPLDLTPEASQHYVVLGGASGGSLNQSIRRSYSCRQAASLTVRPR